MAHTKIIEKAITFDDILLVPAKSKVLPRDVNISARLTKNITLNTPILSAAMDTVTESELAIAMAREGGIGILHKNMSIEKQASEVDRVKRSESGMILDPITLKVNQTVGDANRLMERYKISGFPIINDENELIGVLTNRDLRFEPNQNTKVSELMTKENLVTAPVGTTLEQAERILQKHKVEKLPVVDKNGKIKGLITFKDIIKRKKHPFAAKDSHGRLICGAAVGIASDTLDRVAALVKASVDVVVVDTAHGHSQGVLNIVKEIKKNFDIDVIAGNVATAEGTLDLIKAGVDAVKVGIGAGSICTTRVVAGVGMPQITAVFNAVSAAAKYKIPIISDGGIKQTGDIPKAIAAGADCIMVGGLLAGTEESPGEKVLYEGRVFKMYRGMGSLEAMKAGSGDRYFQDPESELSKLVPEGIEGRVPYKGPLSDVIYQMVGGLRAAMGYCGCGTIAELQKNAKFIEITNAGLKESHPHDVIVTKEAPNYQVRR
ncbi:MAG TPA: IMP dehydrogenase [Ignavibacteria bacterium]|nr:IMP dehydrogenase [Ignavibacteria bacterium]HMQ99725.1 IMP dehydrogenase [Ignavibacteria bacterium]